MGGAFLMATGGSIFTGGLLQITCFVQRFFLFARMLLLRLFLFFFFTLGSHLLVSIWAAVFWVLNLFPIVFVQLRYFRPCFSFQLLLCLLLLELLDACVGLSWLRTSWFFLSSFQALLRSFA